MQWLPYLGGSEHLVAEFVRATLNVPRLETRIQDGDHWDYSLFVAAKHIHTFSTCATYWGNHPHNARAARTAATRLASDWGLEVGAVQRYHRAWDSPPWRRFPAFRRRGRAYERDMSEYGDLSQMFGFVRAVGGDDVTNVVDHATRHATTPRDLDRLRSAVDAITDEPRNER